ncbi:MAG: type IV pilus modification PilV family protein [Kiritimatiellia bacterium]|jgi:prepilin-type N-terminal cleavage/methylation domain-containing protein
MKRNGFSLVEAMIAAGIVAIGLTAAASLVGALMAKEEINSISLRAANLQEQAVMLYRLGLSPTRIREILPETCTDTATPAAGTYGLTFGAPTAVSCTASDGSTFTVTDATCTLTYPITAPDGSVLSYRPNSVNIVMPATVWPVP